MSNITTILAGILIILILILIGLVLYKRKKYLESTKQRTRNIYDYNNPPTPYDGFEQQPLPLNQTQLAIPKKAKFQVPAFVRSIQTTTRDSFIIGVEVGSAEKLELNQQLAIVGEEIIQEKLERIDTRTYKQEKEPEIVDKLNELISIMGKNPNELESTKEKKIPEEPNKLLKVTIDSANTEETNTNSTTTMKPADDSSKTEQKPEKKPWNLERPQKDVECSVCHKVRKTRWRPKTPGEEYVCYKCKDLKEAKDVVEDQEEQKND